MSKTGSRFHPTYVYCSSNSNNINVIQTLFSTQMNARMASDEEYFPLLTQPEFTVTTLLVPTSPIIHSNNLDDEDGKNATSFIISVGITNNLKSTSHSLVNHPSYTVLT